MKGGFSAGGTVPSPRLRQVAVLLLLASSCRSPDAHRTVYDFVHDERRRWRASDF